MAEKPKTTPPDSVVNHFHKNLDVESVKIEKNSRGYNYELKAGTVERALEMVDAIEAKLAGKMTPASKE